MTYQGTLLVARSITPLVGRHQALQERSSAFSVVLANPELRWPHRKVEPRDPSESEEVLKTIAFHEIIDRLSFKKRRGKRDQACIACRQHSHERDVWRRFGSRETVDRINVTRRTYHDVPGKLFAALWAEHAWKPFFGRLTRR